jgi:hypothetical protein
MTANDNARETRIASFERYIAIIAVMIPKISTIRSGGIPIAVRGIKVSPTPAPSNPKLSPIADLSNLAPAQRSIIPVIKKKAGRINGAI